MVGLIGITPAEIGGLLQMVHGLVEGTGGVMVHDGVATSQAVFGGGSPGVKSNLRVEPFGDSIVWWIELEGAANMEGEELSEPIVWLGWGRSGR